MTSVFLVEMVRPKSSQAFANRSMLSCISDSVLALSAQSSTNRKSRAVSSRTFVLACSLRRLKRLPPVRYRKLAPISPSRKGSDSIAENSMLNRVGASTQPCFSPLVTKKGSEYSPPSCTLVFMPSWNCRTIAINLAGQPNLAMILKQPLTADSVRGFSEIHEGGIETFSSAEAPYTKGNF